MSTDYQKRLARWNERNNKIVECLQTVDTLQCLESLVNAKRDRIAALVLAEQYEKLGFGHRSKAQQWRDRALAGLSELEVARIENIARGLQHEAFFRATPNQRR